MKNDHIFRRQGTSTKHIKTNIFVLAYLEDGVLQTDSTKLRLHYMNSTTFYVDMLCLLPLDFLYLSLHFQVYIHYISRFTFLTFPGIYSSHFQVYIPYISMYIFLTFPGIHSLHFQVYIPYISRNIFLTFPGIYSLHFQVYFLTFPGIYIRYISRYIFLTFPGIYIFLHFQVYTPHISRLTFFLFSGIYSIRKDLVF